MVIPEARSLASRASPRAQPSMRIGIDATALPPQRTGVANYLYGLLRGLARVDDETRYVVFAQPSHITQFGIDRPNFQFEAVDLSRRGLRLAWEQAGLPRRIRAHGLDVLHSPHYTMPFRHPAGSVVTFCDMTFILHPELHEAVKRVFFPAMMRWSARHADHLITISESTRDDLVRLWRVAPERVTAVPLAAGSEYEPASPAAIAAACAQYGLRADAYALYVGVLEPRKNVDGLITAFGRVAPRVPGLDLVIAGKRGWMYDRIFAQVKALGLTDRVRFIGYVTQEHLPGLYGGARLFVYPSRYEGFGLPVLEAMHCGVPVITTNVSAMPEVAGDGALLVGPDDIPGLADAMLRVLGDTSFAHGLARRGRERAAGFSWERCALDTRRVYEQVVARRRGAL
ncbi:MAG: glycosyltransferase family 4 protein [Gemmatimonadales bacterium]